MLKRRLFLCVVGLCCFASFGFMLNACDGGSSGCEPPAGSSLTDPGTAPFVPVPEDQVAEACGLDPDLLTQADSEIGTDYIVVRYGKLCHQYLPNGADTPTPVWSTTKTLGAVVTGIASYETRDLPRTGRKTGQLSDTDRADHWIDDFKYHPDALVAHVLGMVSHNETLDDGNMFFNYDGVGDYALNTLGYMINNAIAQDSARLGNNLEQFTRRFLYRPLGMTSSTWTYGLPNKTFGISWRTTMHDMARVGLLMLHGGMYNGKRVLAEGWIYRMTHPSFEESNTAYGYLTWLNTRGGGTSPLWSELGEPLTEYDLCAPVPRWNSYPHSPSTFPDCKADPGYDCRQTYDVGVWSAQGMEGQFIVGHPGLDLLIVAKNYKKTPFPDGLWESIRPALVALDPVYKGDEAAFCAAYGGNNYAPDLKWEPKP